MLESKLFTKIIIEGVFFTIYTNSYLKISLVRPGVSMIYKLFGKFGIYILSFSNFKWLLTFLISLISL